MTIIRADGSKQELTLKLPIGTAIEVDDCFRGGTLPHVPRQRLTD